MLKCNWLNEQKRDVFISDELVVTLLSHYVSFCLIGAVWLGTVDVWKTAFIALDLSCVLFCTPVCFYILS